MKTKLIKIFAVALTVVLLGSLTVGLAVSPAGAINSTLKFDKLPLPKVENWSDEATFAVNEGHYVLTPGMSVGPIAVSPDGGTLLAAAAPGNYVGASWFEIMKSLDGGFTWSVTGFYAEASRFDTKPADPTSIVAIKFSPEFADDNTIIVATQAEVYQSVDGGKNFVSMTEGSPPWLGIITSLDVTMDTAGRLALMVGIGNGGGDVWVFSTHTGLKWTDQLIGSSSVGYSNVMACAFHPDFADSEGICAIVSDGSDTYMQFSFGNTATGGGWGTDIGNAHFLAADSSTFGLNYYTSVASIAFPDDFDAFGIGNNVCFVGLTTFLDMPFPDASTTPQGNDGSDAYKVSLHDGAPSSADDLNVRGVITTLLPTATTVTSIQATGDAADATILVGVDCGNLAMTPAEFTAYYSQDSGDSWAPAGKGPTGGIDWSSPASVTYGMAFTRVLMAPDFATSNKAYAATIGAGTSAFQLTTDGGDSWNQISLIDYGDKTAGYMLAPFHGLDATGYTASGTVYIATQFSGGWATPNGAVWTTTNSGKNWQRIFSYANLNVTPAIDQVIINGDAVFAVDYPAFKIYRSTNNGATFPKTITTKDDLTTVAVVSPTTLYTGHSDGNIYWSTKSGVGWTKPDNSEIPAGTYITYIVVAGEKLLISTGYYGAPSDAVFVSDDGGETINRLGISDPGGHGAPGDDEITVATPDLGFATNNIVYAVNVDALGGGVWRTEVDWADPSASVWVQIDSYQPTGSPYDVAGDVNPTSAALVLPPSGVLYVLDGTPADTTTTYDGGGLWRSTNPTASVSGVHPPYFERYNKGLNNNDVIAFLGLDVGGPPNLPPTIFAVNMAAWGPSYYDQVVLFTDILNIGATLAVPADGATGVGILPENMVGKVYPDVSFAWNEMAGATSYQYQIAMDPDFKSVIAWGYTTSMGTELRDTLDPNTNFYWRVRVAQTDTAGNVLGAWLISPWSATYKFKTTIGASMARPALQAPAAGEEGVPLSPTFEWSGITWAEVYEYELALDPTTTAGGYFTEPLVALIGTDALVSTAWKCDITLDYSTRYYWHVKAIGVDTDTPWSDVGTFTTMEVPPEPTTEAPPITIPPTQEITPAWIWAVVIIGAILVIAVIVLIVTTRRVP
jgi:hypothetical protein